MRGNFPGISEFKTGGADSTPGAASLELYFDHQAREMGLLMELARGYRSLPSPSPAKLSRNTRTHRAPLLKL